MSNWINVTNLPSYYEEEEITELFGDIGPIKQIEIEAIPCSSKSTVLIQFLNTRAARLAATRKDQTMVGDSTIRVRVVWCRKETLTTVKVSNLPLDITEFELRDYFATYGDIVDIHFSKMIHSSVTQRGNETYNNNNNTNGVVNKEIVAWVSFARVDNAVRACHEMDHSILNGSGDDSGICVQLINPDSRNLKWKRNVFEYVRCPLLPKRTKGLHIHKTAYSNNGRKMLGSNGKSPICKEQSSIESAASSDSSPTCAHGLPQTYTPLLNVSPTLLNKSVQINNSGNNWFPSICNANNAIHGNTGTSNTPPNWVCGINNASNTNVGTVPCPLNNGITNTSTNLSNMMPSLHLNCFRHENNNNNNNNVANGNVIPKLNLENLRLLESKTHLQQSSGVFPQQYNHSLSNSLFPNNLKSESARPSVMVNNTSGIWNGGNVSNNVNAFLAIPQTKSGSFVSPVSSSSSTPLSFNDLPMFPMLIEKSSSHGSTASTLQQTPVQIGTVKTSTSNANNYTFSPNSVQSPVPSFGSLNLIATNPIQTLPNIPISGKFTSTSSIISGTTLSSRSLSNSSATSSSSATGVKVIVTDLSNATFSQKKSTESVSTATSDASLSSSVWSAEQRGVGDTIYHELKSKFPERVAKITGMMLSLPKDELERLLADKNKLEARANQFVQLLDAHKSRNSC